MPMIEISEEDLKFLQDLSREMRNQDNRATASPYYYVVQTTKTLPSDPNFSEEKVWIDSYTMYKTYDEIREDFGVTTDEEVEAIIDSQMDETAIQDVEEEHNVFLTLKGYEEHMKLNGHNYRAPFKNNACSYIKHAYRNPEMKRLFEVIHNIGKK